MAEVAQLKTHIINYSKTREVYAAYKKSRHKKEFLAKHRAEIAQHEAAKKAFDALGGKPILKVAQLSQGIHRNGACYCGVPFRDQRIAIGIL